MDTRSSQIPVGSVPEGEPTFFPIFGKVVLEIDKKLDRKYGKLILPQREAIRSSMGRVIAVYEGTDTPDGRVEPEVKVGDLIIIGQFSGTAMEIGERLFVICKEHDLLTRIVFPDEKLALVTEVIE